MDQVNYNEISRVYDDVRQADVDLLNSFLAEIEPNENFRVLDLGCGTGNYADLLQKLTQGEVYGVEPSVGMLEKAKAKDSKVIFREGQADVLPFDAEFFDFVYMTDVIHHVPNIIAMFAEIRRVLKEAGKVCIATQSHRQIERRPIVRFFPGTADVDKKRYPDITQIILAAEGQGLKFVKNTVLYADEPTRLDEDFLALVRKKGYSMLHLISADEYKQGLGELESALRKGKIPAKMAGETLLWLMKE